MNPEDHQRGQPAAAPELLQDEHPLLDPAAEPDYRALEGGYHRSADYAEKVDRYPLLSRSIESCRHPHAVQLQWERSHGEA